MTSFFLRASLFAALATTVPAQAQDIPTPTPSPTPAPTLGPIPFDLANPRGLPTPTPVPTASPTPRATRAPVAPRPAPRADVAAEPAPAATPSPVPVSVPVPTPTSSTAPTSAKPTVAAAPDPMPPVAGPRPSSPLWPWLLGGAVLALLGGVWWRRRPSSAEPIALAPPAPPAPPAASVVPLAPPPAVSPEARLALTFRPSRAGLNMLSATVEGQLEVLNTGIADAANIRVRALLLTAGTELDAALRDARAQPVRRPVAPPFTLGPGERRVMRVVAATPRDTLQTMSAAGRPMIVPVLALDAGFTQAQGQGGRAEAAFAVGVERVDSTKLAPIWLDVPPRSYDGVAARAHGVAVER